MDVIEQPMTWLRAFNEGWLAHYERSGEMDWSLYQSIENKQAPSGDGLVLAESRIMLISSAGGYLAGDQFPFDCHDPLGDYSLRLFPTDTPLEDLAFAHTHASAAQMKDPQALLPLQHLAAMEAHGMIGEVASMVVSTMGYQPNALRVVKETIPMIVEIAKRSQVDGALLVPAGEMDIQTMCLIARALEVNRVAAVMVANMQAEDAVRAVAPPRAVLTDLPYESLLGHAGDKTQQQRVLETMVNVLSYHAPVPMVKMREF